uniref:Uncharacterized protein n=1 Tax=Oryza nivara TaxID=4536 RepID=A0A0E0HEQ5_ORYNI
MFSGQAGEEAARVRPLGRSTWGERRRSLERAGCLLVRREAPRWRQAMEGGGRQEWSWAAAAGGRGRPPWPAAEVARHPRMKPSRGSSGWRRLALSRKHEGSKSPMLQPLVVAESCYFTMLLIS